MATTDGVSSTSQTSLTGSAASKKTLADNFDAFLTLLTKQLQNQDPLKPMDSNEFTQQLVQYSSVEQAIKSNENLESLLALFQHQQSSNYVNLIGKDITYQGDELTLGATGSAEWQFENATGTTTYTAQVLNASGQVVYQKTANATSGMTDFSWDGNKTDGTRAPEGVYTLKVTGLTASGTSTTSTIYTTGTVTGIESDGTATSLVVGAFSVDPADIRAVRNPTTTTN